MTRTSLPDYRDLQRDVRSFEGIAVWASNLYDLRTGDETRQVLGGVISRELLPLLGVTPVLGRAFTADDERQNAVILSYGLWQSQFGGDPGILGRGIQLHGTSYTVVGVTPSWFRFPDAQFQLWTALGSIESAAPAQAKNRALRIFRVVGRLRPDATLEQAQAEVDAVAAQLAQTYPETNAAVRFALVPLYEQLVGSARPALLILLVTVALLLLIACANVANLMLARTTARAREMAIRSALGAGRSRLLRQLATESMVLAALGGALGLLLAMWGVDALPAALQARLPRAEAIAIDVTVLAFAFVATVVTGVFFGLAPAWQSAAGSAASLKEAGRGVAGSASGRRIRRIIVVAEVALAVVVLVGAGLLVRSFVSLTARDLGFAPRHALSFIVQFVQHRDDAARAAAAAALMARVSQLPGVEAAGAATGLAAVTPQRGTQFEIEGRTLTPDQNGAFFMAATPGYFTALGTPVLRGRAIDHTDRAGTPSVILINRRLADTLFAGEDPVGRRLRLVNPEQASDWRTIVGVVGDVRYQGFENDVQPTVYTPFAQTPFMWLYVTLRTTGDPAPLAASLGPVVRAVDPRLTASNIRPMTEIVSSTVEEPRFNMLLVSSFALLALALATIGIYGVIAYSVAQRTHEIGVRIALGAARGDVMSLVVREGVVIAGLGILLGLAGSAMLTRLMASQLVGVAPRDPVAFTAGGLLLLAVAVLASCLPAWRASRVDPIVALRTE